MTPTNLFTYHFGLQHERYAVDATALQPKGLKLLPNRFFMFNINLLRYLQYALCIGAMLISDTVFSQQPQPSINVVAERLNSIERENQQLREDITRLEDANKELTDSLKEYEPFKFWAWILAILGISSVGGLALLYFKVIPNKVNSQVDVIIAKLLTDRREDFLGLLKEYDFEKTVKQRHRIVLLSHRKGNDDYHHRMLTKNGFQVEAYTNLDQLQGIEFTADDIIIINNDGDHWAPDQVQVFINAHPNYCFYFGNGRISVEGERLNRFTAANFRTQFIGNLMNVLKYSHHQN
ncbi:hypothetical protein [Fibrella arboris]|uniref:hypothetical protein n=1 Tax=Fibrella arboris TaxID=3242486 RepID=UPI003521DB29